MDVPEYRDFDAQLQGLGFRPLGGYAKTVRFFLHYWVKTYRGRVFLAPDRRCAAKIYWLHALDLPRVSFNSLLSNGALLETSNALEQLRIEKADHLRWGYVTRDLGDLLGLHQAAVAAWTGAGAPPQNFGDLTQILAVDERVDWHRLARTWSTSALLLVVYLMFFTSVGFIVTNELGEHPCAQPVAALAGGLCVLFLRLMHLVHVRAHRQAELSRARTAAEPGA